jgi:hypothetical protein
MVSTIIAAALFEAGTAAYAATVFAVNFALSQIVTRVFGQDQQGPQDNGVRQQVPPSTTNALPVAYGDVYMGGTFVDAVLSTDQKTMYYVLAISSISPNGQFSYDTTKFYYGDRLITFDGTDQTKVVSLTDEAGNVDTKISGNLYINLYKSSASGTITPINTSSAPSTVMGGTDIASAQRWPSTGRQMNGLAFAIVKLNYSQDAGTTSLSPITFHVSHYLNNAGCAKPGDVWYDYITNTIYGGAVDTSFVDSASATTLNSYSDELITFKNSSGIPSTQARYRMNGVLDAGQTVLSNIDKIMSCCDSWMTYNSSSGQWSVVTNKPETAAFAFNDNNIIGEIRVSATDITSSINQVEAKFPFKDNRDQPSYVQLATPSSLLYPNEPVNKYSITYDLVNESVQASYLANRLLEQAREDLIVSFSTTYYGIQVDAGAVVSVTNSAYGWTNKLFRVVKVNEASLPDGSLGAKLELNEYNAAVYDDLDVTAFTPAPNSNIPSVTYFSALSAPTVSGHPTASVPNFDVTITIPTTGRVTWAYLYFTTVASPSPSDWKLLASAASSNSQPVTNGTTYLFSNQVLSSGTYYFGYIVGNETGQSVISPISASFAWSPVAPTGPTGATGPTGTLGPTGSSGTNGNSSRICYTKTSLSSLASTPTTITTSGSSSYPPNDSWGTGTVWGATAPSITAGESVYQSDGVYSPSTGNTVWNVPYLSTLKVGSLSAITTNTGSLTVSGTIQSNTAAISGTTMTGSGGVLYSSGNFAFGNSTTNIAFNGTQLTLNGNVVATANINPNAVSTYTTHLFGNVSGTGGGTTPVWYYTPALYNGIVFLSFRALAGSGVINHIDVQVGATPVGSGNLTFLSLYQSAEASNTSSYFTLAFPYTSTSSDTYAASATFYCTNSSVYILSVSMAIIDFKR